VGSSHTVSAAQADPLVARVTATLSQVGDCLTSHMRCSLATVSLGGMARIIDDEAGVADVVRRSNRIAVLGIKTEAQAGQPSYDVPAYLQGQGFEVIPVPVYYPEVTTILGQRVYRKVVDVPGAIDVVDVFRRPVDLMDHLDDLVAAKPKVVWLQLGIRHEEFAKRLVGAGIDVVQDRCLLVEHRLVVRQR
jgi:uncharacterized protein